MEGQAQRKSVQTTLDQAFVAADDAGGYDHLVRHLIDDEEEDKASFQWTRVFSRDDIGRKRAAAYPIGLDLQFDASMQEVLMQNQDAAGQVAFSPQLFEKGDIPADVAESRLGTEELMMFGQLATRAKMRFTQALQALGGQQADGDEESKDARDSQVPALKRGYSRTTLPPTVE